MKTRNERSSISKKITDLSDLVSGTVGKPIFPLIWFIFLLLVGFIIYLPKPSALGLFNDDWYLMYDAKVMGTSFFTTIFAIDRPLRAPLQTLLYSVFGESVVLYQLSALVLRALSAVFFGLAIKTASKRDQSVALVASFLFFIYPGFLSQPNAIDYQAHLTSLTLAMASIWLFVLSARSWSTHRAWLFGGASIILTLLYLGLMEYFLGIEVFKLALGYYALDGFSWRSKLERLRNNFFILVAWVFEVGGFLFWRIFLFESERKATDITGKLDLLSGSVLNNFVSWSLGVFVNFFHAVVGAWVVPFYQAVIKVAPKDLLFDLLWLLGSAAVLWLLFSEHHDPKDIEEPSFLWVGFVGALAAIFPVVFAGRSIDFGDYSRYTLPVIASSVLLMAVLVERIDHKFWRFGVILFLFMSALITHRQNFLTFADRTSSEQAFWWQVSWRVPDLRDDTTIIVSYPDASIQEDYFVWGPANFIYSDQKSGGNPLIVPINALVLNQENLNLIVAGRGQVEHLRRGNQTYADLGKVLVFSQASPSSCVKVMDYSFLEVSEYENSSIRVVATVSDPSLIDTAGNHSTPPQTIFGKEPENGWCFYFEKAELARQQEDWSKVIKLGDEALAMGYYPGDRSEWMPFLHANIMLGNTSAIKQIGKRFIENKMLKQMACENFLPIAPDDSGRAAVEEIFCR